VDRRKKKDLRAFVREWNQSRRSIAMR
jgi:hypothetical protein